MLTRSTPLARAGRLRPVSKKRAKEQRQQQKAYGAAADAEQCWCSVCGKPGPTEHMHLFTQKQHKNLRSNPLNWLVVGKHCGCHDLQENNKPEFARRHPGVWARILSQMRELHPEAYRLFRLKNPF